jgi:hypothetical protein
LVGDEAFALDGEEILEKIKEEDWLGAVISEIILEFFDEFHQCVWVVVVQDIKQDLEVVLINKMEDKEGRMLDLDVILGEGTVQGLEIGVIQKHWSILVVSLDEENYTQHHLVDYGFFHLISLLLSLCLELLSVRVQLKNLQEKILKSHAS